jgi:thioredoxin reductase (NADPH)
VFAAGDVRSGSVKRVGAAIGEGAVVGAELHTVLANGAAVSPRAAVKEEATGGVSAIGMQLNPTGARERVKG